MYFPVSQHCLCFMERELMGRVKVALMGRRQGQSLSQTQQWLGKLRGGKAGQEFLPVPHHQQALVSVTAQLCVLTDDPGLSAARINGNEQGKAWPGHGRHGKAPAGPEEPEQRCSRRARGTQTSFISCFPN